MNHIDALIKEAWGDPNYSLWRLRKDIGGNWSEHAVRKRAFKLGLGEKARLPGREIPRRIREKMPALMADEACRVADIAEELGTNKQTLLYLSWELGIPRKRCKPSIKKERTRRKKAETAGLARQFLYGGIK